MRSYLIVCLLSLTLISIRSGAQSLDVARLDTLFGRLERHNEAMGSIQLTRGGKVLYSRGFGQAQVGKTTGIPNTPETIYRIGSVTKMFTAAIIFRLIEEHQLLLSDTLARWFPQLPNADRITIDHLLSHHSGLHNLTEDTSFMTWQATPRSQADVLSRLASQRPDFEPGTKAQYSNTNFIVLGYIIEELSGKSYADVLADRLTGPLKLEKTAFGGKIRPDKGHAYSYALESYGWRVVPPSDANVAGGAGGITSTVGDMAEFMEAIFLKKFISAEHLKKMMTLSHGYGRGMIRVPFYDRFAFGHNGQIDNFSSMLVFFPKDSMVLSLVCNGVNYKFNDILIGVLSICYGRPYTIPEFGMSVAVAPEKLKMLEGVYSSKEIGMDITISSTVAGITAQATGQGAFPLAARSETGFSNEELGVRLDFELKAGAGKPDRLILSQGGGRIPFVRKP